MAKYSRRHYLQRRKHYIRTIRKSLPIRIKHRNYVMKNLKQSIENYEETHANCTIEELYQEFGTTEEICESILQETPTEQVLRDMTWKRKIISILLCVIILAFAFIVYCEIRAYLFSPASIEIYLDDSPSVE